MYVNKNNIKYKGYSIKWSASKNVYHIWDANNIPCGYGLSIKQCKKIIDANTRIEDKKKG